MSNLCLSFLKPPPTHNAPYRTVKVLLNKATTEYKASFQNDITYLVLKFKKFI